MVFPAFFDCLHRLKTKKRYDPQVGAVCHGTVGLAEMKAPDTGKHFVSGKKVTSFTDDEEREVGLDKVSRGRKRSSNAADM